MRIGILEDEEKVRLSIQEYISRYFKEKGSNVELFPFGDAFSLLENYHADYDVLFMDIQMKLMNGMEAAFKIREKDPHVLIVFVTNLAQYAVEGYAVNAFDFILKPIDYHGFSMKLDRIVNEIQHRNTGKFINIKAKSGLVRIDINELSYVEVRKHDLIYHVGKESIVARGALKDITEELKPYYFALCNNSYLVNLAFVRKASKSIELSTGEELFISQGKRKQFMADLARYAGGTI